VPKDFLTLADWHADELRRMLARAAELKATHHKGERPRTLRGLTLALYFEKPSLRTHVTFEAGMTQLGGHAILLRPEQVGIGIREAAGDVARNLSLWVDALLARVYSHALVEELARAARIPVINGLSDLFHPCQALADLQTICERTQLEKAVLAYVGDGNNVANSLLMGAGVLGFELRLATPPAYRPPEAVWRRAEALARRSGARLSWSADPVEAVRGAGFVYTDVWTSMGQESEAEERKKVFHPYQVNARLLAGAPDAWIMHCLPAHRGEEITGEVLDGPRSIVFDQAENRLHAQKAVLERLLGVYT
jgi:ornithine carbamoyltransferase